MLSPPTQDSTLSLHDALPTSARQHVETSSTARFKPHSRFLHHAETGSGQRSSPRDCCTTIHAPCSARPAMIAATMTSGHPDRKSTRLNSSHLGISYAVFCLKI